ncbi:hypothetical protein J6590_074075 [Homalodisca vitripennis]|nr:hypothetical protein J6590_074075 [Homalodisca vitripennis]
MLDPRSSLGWFRTGQHCQVFETGERPSRPSLGSPLTVSAYDRRWRFGDGCRVPVESPTTSVGTGSSGEDAMAAGALSRDVDGVSGLEEARAPTIIPARIRFPRMERSDVVPGSQFLHEGIHEHGLHVYGVVQVQVVSMRQSGEEKLGAGRSGHDVVLQVAVNVTLLLSQRKQPSSLKIIRLKQLRRTED